MRPSATALNIIDSLIGDSISSGNKFTRFARCYAPFDYRDLLLEKFSITTLRTFGKTISFTRILHIVRLRAIPQMPWIGTSGHITRMQNARQCPESVMQIKRDLMSFVCLIMQFKSTISPSFYSNFGTSPKPAHIRIFCGDGIPPKPISNFFTACELGIFSLVLYVMSVVNIAVNKKILAVTIWYNTRFDAGRDGSTHASILLQTKEIR